MQTCAVQATGPLRTMLPTATVPWSQSSTARSESPAGRLATEAQWHRDSALLTYRCGAAPDWPRRLHRLPFTRATVRSTST